MASNNLEYTLRLKDLFSKTMRGAVVETKKLDNSMIKLKSMVGNLFVGLGAAYITKDIVQTTAKFQSLENAIKATGDGKNLKFLNEQVDRLGLDITAAYQGYKTFSGALMGTALAGEQGNKVFRQVSEAATVMGLSGEQTEGAFLALGQMMGKGTVSAEELRGQLGERIPGAFQIAAKAMGVTTEALGKMMQKGQIVAADFLPKFGNELEKRFGKQAANASESLQSNLNKLDASWQRLKVSIGTALLPLIIKIVKVFSVLINVIKALLPLIQMAITLWVAYIIQLKIGAISSYYFAVANRAMAMGMTKSAVAATFLSRGIRSIGMAIKSVPIIGWIALAVEGLMMIYDKFEKVRGVIYGFIYGIKEAFTNVGSILKGIGYIMIGQFSKGIGLLKDSFSNIGNAAFKGYGKGIENFRNKDKIEGMDSSLMGAEGMAGGVDGGKGTKSLGTGSEVSGQRPQAINISIDKLVNELNIQTTNLTEGAGRMKELVSKALLEAVNDINLIAMA